MPVTQIEVGSVGICVERVSEVCFRLYLAEENVKRIALGAIKNITRKRRPNTKEGKLLTLPVGVMLVYSIHYCPQVKLLDVYPNYVEVTVKNEGCMRSALREIVYFARCATLWEFSPVYRLASHVVPAEWDALLDDLFGEVGRS